MMITFKDLLTIYWSQTLLIFSSIIGLIAYFSKRYFDLKSKKKEINHSIYQQVFTDGFKSHLGYYISIIKLVDDYPSIYHGDKNNIDIFLEKINLKYNEFSTSEIYVRCFIDDDLYSSIHLLSDQVNTIIDSIYKRHISFQQLSTDIEDGKYSIRLLEIWKRDNLMSWMNMLPEIRNKEKDIIKKISKATYIYFSK